MTKKEKQNDGKVREVTGEDGRLRESTGGDGKIREKCGIRKNTYC